ncbi:MAG: hypothetical protein QME76_04125 [Bacillota bacterium]|nr:hypothetical protein [Bacillota bacterium]
MFAYFVVLGLLSILFIKINGRLFDQRTAGVSGLAALVLAGLFPFSAFSFGPVKTVLLYLGTAPLIALGACCYLTRLRTARPDGIQSPPLALPPAPAVAALPPAKVQAVDGRVEAQPAPVEGPAGIFAVSAAEVLPRTAPEIRADGPLTATAEAVPESAREAAETPREELPSPAGDALTAATEAVAEAADEAEADMPAGADEPAGTQEPPAEAVCEAAEMPAGAEETPADTVAEEPADTAPAAAVEERDDDSPRDLVNRALAAARRRDFVRAVTILTEALRLHPEPALEWVIVAQMSDIYQHLGQYRLAAELISAFLSMRKAADHPLVPILWQKEAFCRSLDRLLTRRGTPNMAYASVPEDLKGLAFREAMAVPAA